MVPFNTLKLLSLPAVEKNSKVTVSWGLTGALVVCSGTAKVTGKVTGPEVKVRAGKRT